MDRMERLRKINDLLDRTKSVIASPTDSITERVARRNLLLFLRRQLDQQIRLLDMHRPKEV